MSRSIVIALAVLAGWFAVAAADSARPETGTGIGQRIPQFTAPLVDVVGAKPQTGELDSHRTKNVTAYVVVGARCPTTQAYAPRLAELARTYTKKGVDFVYVYPNREDTPEDKVAFHKKNELAGFLIDDKGGKVARLLGAQRTSEIIVADQKGIIVYHGAVDDSRDPEAVSKRYMALALDETLAGKPVTVSTSQVFA